MADIQFRFITYTINGVPHVRMTDPPHIKAQVIKFNDNKKAEDFNKQHKVRITGRTEGYNVFLRHAGFHEKPKRFITTEEIEFVIKKMCAWYSATQKKRYKIKQ